MVMGGPVFESSGKSAVNSIELLAGRRLPGPALAGGHRGRAVRGENQ
jgi:hypothetical protein